MTAERPAFRLAVAVPTYNRADCLRRLLIDVASQIRADRLHDQVQICVSDNASPDDTQRVLADFRRDFSDISLASGRNDRNTLFVGNMRSVASLGDAEYIALTGDDDSLRPGALKRILGACDGRFDLILWNSLPGAGRWIRTLKRDDGTVRVFHNGNEVNSALGVFHASFLGNCVFRRQAFISAYLREYEVSKYPHTYVALHLLNEGPALFVNFATFAVDESRREWWALQPWLTAVDMAKLQTDMVLERGAKRGDVARVYHELSRSVPRAVLHSRRSPGTLPVTVRDLWTGYRCSRFYQALALAYWASARALPVSVLDWVIGVFSTQQRAALP